MSREGRFSLVTFSFAQRCSDSHVKVKVQQNIEFMSVSSYIARSCFGLSVCPEVPVESRIFDMSGHTCKNRSPRIAWDEQARRLRTAGIIVKLLVFTSSVFSAKLGSPTLRERMGGEFEIKPLCDDLYEMHASDLLTASWFGSDVAGNIWSSEE